MIVYKHTNRNNEKAYIGWSTLTIDERWTKHLHDVATGSMRLFHNAIRKHGVDVWDHEVLETHETSDDAKSAEIRLIAEHKTFAFEHPDKGYNMTPGGDGISGAVVIASNQNRETTMSTRVLMGIKRRNRVLSDDHRRQISETHAGRSWSPEHRVKHKLAQEKRVIRLQNQKLNDGDSQLVLLCGGPDRCGKTNILRELERITGVPYYKAGNEHRNFLFSQDYFINELRYSDPKMVDFLYQTGASVLVDRAYMCEFSYAQFFNRNTDMQMLRELDASYARLGAKILICTRRSFVGIQDDLSPQIDEHALQKLSDLYMTFVKWTKCQTYVLYVDDENLDREVNEVLEFVGKLP